MSHRGGALPNNRAVSGTDPKGCGGKAHRACDGCWLDQIAAFAR